MADTKSAIIHYILIISCFRKFLPRHILKRAEKYGCFTADGFAVDFICGEAEGSDG